MRNLMKQVILCINVFSHSHCLDIYIYIYLCIDIYIDIYTLVLYISVLYEYIYFSMHVQVNYYEHLHCCSFN